MCGIVGYVGPKEATDFLVNGLRRLEYRGYDSSGVATLAGAGKLNITKSTGRIDRLVELLEDQPAPGNLGIGHTRWATHGPATNENAHPHIGGDNILAVVHNGVVENYRPLKERLEEKGYVFHSATDTEVVAHLIADCYSQIKEN
jgi:glucosamine--fructose-6-phosphate aminotransferase (isomerizing)